MKKTNKSQQNLIKEIEKAVEEFNEYRSPEAVASIISIKDNEVKIKLSGPFCKTCGVYDYFDDLKIKLESFTGLNFKMEVVSENDDSYIIKFIFER
jgi:hypothetical protein